MIRYFTPFYQRWMDFQAKKVVLWLVFLASIFLVLSFAIHLPAMQSLDLAVTQSIQSARNPLLDSVADGLTFSGNTVTLLVVGGFAALSFALRHRKLEAVLCLVALLGVPLNYAIKEVIGRPRPDGSVVSVLLPTVGLSFPSGHAMASTMLYGFLAAMCWTHLRDKVLRIVCTVGFAFLPLFISLSRIYVGAHWLSDVVGGWTAGLLCLLVLMQIFRSRTEQPETR